MNLYIRADADSKIGTGHVMRCIALAQAWQDQGGEVTFISRCESEALRGRIIQEGFKFIAIENSHPDLSDLDCMMGIFEQLKIQNSKFKTWVVLDGYNFTSDYQKIIHAAGIHLMVIDDISHLPYYHADILLNQNIHATDLKYHYDEDTDLRLGTHYVLLRREFLKHRDFKRQIPDRAKNILVTLGGSDPDNVTLKVIEAIKLLKDQSLQVKIVIGPSNPHIAALKNSSFSAPCPIHYIENAGNMPELMEWGDIAISAGGSTCWELAFMGTPFLMIVLAENQIAIASGLDAQGVAIHCGGAKEINLKKFSKILSDIIFNKDKRTLMHLKAKKLIDGNGAMRVCTTMKGLAL
jgi:UDP-2,4-diacetamido-2,4,6-trideoxy-beta-L-altropyranose hydrolase